MRNLWQNPTGIYLRMWPINSYDRSVEARLRWNTTASADRQERRVIINQRHSDTPMDPLHYRMWDELRTDLALGQRAGTQVWTGLARDPAGDWCQDHAFCVIMRERLPVQVISLHYHRWLAQGHPRRNPQVSYQDWTFDSRRLQDITGEGDMVNT